MENKELLEALDRLEAHNKWRRGDDASAKLGCVKQLGEDIDLIISSYRAHLTQPLPADREAAIKLINHLAEHVSWEDEPVDFDKGVETIRAALQQPAKVVDEMTLAIIEDNIRHNLDKHIPIDLNIGTRVISQEIVKSIRPHLTNQGNVDRWMPIETCPKEHGVDYRLWDENELQEVVTWFGNGEWCCEGDYTHWMPLPPAPNSEKDN